MWEVFEADPARGNDFATVMTAASSKFPGAQVQYLIDLFPWRNVRTVIDVGGSHGSVGQGVVKVFPHLLWTVQDKAEIVADAETNLSDDMKVRVQFMAQ